MADVIDVAEILPFLLNEYEKKTFYNKVIRSSNRIVTFKISEELLDEVNYYAKKLGVSRSEFIRMALFFFIRYVRGFDLTKNVRRVYLG